MSCPICSKTTDPEYRPFCSKRCADVDLAKWLGGSYAIPSEDPEDMEEAAQAVEREERKPH
ncbi:MULTISPECIES: DNA gyrase inhibitor YacG [Mameliella]|uniref:DNA gyrase inhibitor YacG n=1 Tax=Mameliella alba TaxID=561184 RepID=A0A0B3RU38_9RHOB|nr:MULTISPECIES: DNA gyrase inhibitor YacG [Mameliella]MCR9273386.1 DNA gyrase inhibitor YacG [Paracoccaceae bacterium]ODM49099.1 DNA gyrase inhibitor [Ruegeria sp. PBVC088]KHQ54470.1 DNA gyrase inhibitor YacG [Mameliella alba]MBY6118374.1 DNA gyrase inhibitor YacG [Mameliella alba]MDD9732774.1 DNA gyrase inhibitor YacG [Mameliella sp. AT18]